MSAAHTWYRDVCIPTSRSTAKRSVCFPGYTYRLVCDKCVQHPCVCNHKQDIRSVEYRTLGKATTAWVVTDRPVCPHGSTEDMVCYRHIPGKQTAWQGTDRPGVYRVNGRLLTTRTIDRAVCIHGVSLRESCTHCKAE